RVESGDLAKMRPRPERGSLFAVRRHGRGARLDHEEAVPLLALFRDDRTGVERALVEERGQLPELLLRQRREERHVLESRGLHRYGWSLLVSASECDPLGLLAFRPSPFPFDAEASPT